MGDQRYWQTGGQLLDDLLAGGPPEILRDFFQERIQEWDSPFRHDETFTIGVFDDLAELPSDVAFAALPVAASVALDARDTERFELAIVLLRTLVRVSDTTEIPVELADAWQALAQETREQKRPGLRTMWQEVAAHYRRR
jgi:hypothetical protein